jgi:hypothetical protein
VQLVLDADALIKLNRADILAIVLSHFECIVPVDVYDEVVTTGGLLGYPDASTIGEILAGHVDIAPKKELGSETGKGEQAVLALLARMPSAYAVSDDRRFLRQLEASGLSYQTPVDVLVALHQLGAIQRTQALASLERMRDLIRPQAYSEGRQDIQDYLETP